MEFEPRDRAAYIPAADILVCADLHIGLDASSNVELRIGEQKDMVDRFTALVEYFEPSVTVLAGDILHAFGDIPTGATSTLTALREAADAGGSRLVAVSGNHDTMLPELWPDTLTDTYEVSATNGVIAHGHDPIEFDGDWCIIGHDHPMITIEGVRRPCFLYGTDQYDGADILMLPAFSRLPVGVSVNTLTARDLQTPLITEMGTVRPIVYDEDADDIHEFPPLGHLQGLL